MTYPFIPNRKAIIKIKKKTLNNNNNAKEQWLARIYRHYNPHTLLMGMHNRAPPVEITWAVAQKVKYRVTIWFSNSAPRHIPRRNEKVKTRTRTFTAAQHSNQKVETTQMSIAWRKDKQMMVHVPSGMLLSYEKDEVLLYEMDEPWKFYAKRKKPNTKVDVS